MARKGAPEGNQHAAKGEKGKAITIYVPARALSDIREQLEREGYPASALEEMINERAREYALTGIESGVSPSPELDKWRFLADGWQVLSNHAEVMAPELLNNVHWMAMKADLERRSDEVGLTAFIQRIADERRERLEQEEDEED